MPRLLLLIVMLSFLGIRVAFQRDRGDADRTAVRTARERWLTRLVLVTQFVPAWLYIGKPFIRFANLEVPDAVRYVGAGVAALGIGLLWWVHHTLGRNFSPWLELRDEHTLITAGPYARIRHPMYTAGFLLALSYALISANLIMALLPLVGLVPLVLVRIPDEESMMLARFGDTYRAYMARTGRLLPRLG